MLGHVGVSYQGSVQWRETITENLLQIVELDSKHRKMLKCNNWRLLK